MEVTDIGGLSNNVVKLLDQKLLDQKVSAAAAGAAAAAATAAATATTSTYNPTQTPMKLNLLVVSLNLKTRSSYSRVARRCIDLLKCHETLNVTNYEINTHEIDNLVTAIKEQDIVFFILSPKFIQDILQYYKNSAKTFESWCYFKPKTNAVDNTVIDWLNKEISVVFVPTAILKTSLKQRLNRPVELLDIGVSDKSFFPVNKLNARKIIDIPEEKRVWLAPASNTKLSHLDLVIQAFVEYLGKLSDSENELLICLGDVNQPAGYYLYDIYTTEIQSRGYDLKKYEKNLCVLDPQTLQGGLSDNILNCFYNSADAVVFTNSYSNHSFTPMEVSVTNNNKTLFLPKHSWFFDTFGSGDATAAPSNPNIIWCNPLQVLYRTNEEGGGTELLIHPSELARQMLAFRDSTEQQIKNQDQVQVTTDVSCDYSMACRKVFDRRIKLVLLSRE